MELNTKARYAVTALADLAKFGGGDALSLASIAERQQLPVAYLEQIFMSLRRSGLVDSARGRSGGYRLSKPAAEVSVADIMRAVEEETRMTSCRDAHTPCRGDKPCLTHSLWTALGAEIDGFLARVSLQDVLDGVPGPSGNGGAVAKSPVAAKKADKGGVTA